MADDSSRKEKVEARYPGITALLSTSISHTRIARRYKVARSTVGAISRRLGIYRREGRSGALRIHTLLAEEGEGIGVALKERVWTALQAAGREEIRFTLAGVTWLVRPDGLVREDGEPGEPADVRRVLLALLAPV